MVRAICRTPADASPASDRQPPTLLKHQQFSLPKAVHVSLVERTGHDHRHLIVLASFFENPAEGLRHSNAQCQRDDVADGSGGGWRRVPTTPDHWKSRKI